MDALVLLEMVGSRELLVTETAHVVSLTRVDSTMTPQFIRTEIIFISQFFFKSKKLQKNFTQKSMNL